MFLLSCSKDNHSEVPELLFDGVYQSNLIDDVWYYLRFYPDGTVIHVTSASRPAELEAWFTKEHQGVSVGKVTLEDSRLSFSCVSRSGTVEYVGKISGHRIQLDSHSHINDYRQSIVYKFVKFTDPSKTSDQQEPTLSSLLDGQAIGTVAFRFVGEKFVDEKRLRSIIRAVPGAIYDNEVIDSDIRALYESRLVEDVRVLAEPAADKVDLVYEVSKTIIVEREPEPTE